MITIDQMLELRRKDENVIVLDVRKERALDGFVVRDSIRIHPDRAVEEVKALELPKDDWLIAFCA